MLNYNIKIIKLKIKKRTDPKTCPSHHLNIIYENYLLLTRLPLKPPPLLFCDLEG